LLYSSNRWDEKRVEVLGFPYDSALKMGQFGVMSPFCYFPLWYPTLALALAGFGAMRLGRRFTLRSAIIATTVVAGLLGMAVAL
jgi:hypothetical protein